MEMLLGLIVLPAWLSVSVMAVSVWLLSVVLVLLFLRLYLVTNRALRQLALCSPFLLS